jgi:transposase-like protein
MGFRSANMKKRIRRRDPQRRSYWEEVVRRWEQGGQSVRGYCRDEGLRESAFYFWRRKLGRGTRATDAGRELTLRASSAVSASQPPEPASGPRRGKASFLPVRVVESREATVPHAVEIAQLVVSRALSHVV